MAGVAGYAGVAHVFFPTVVDVASHLQHVPCDNLGVFFIGGKVLRIVAVGASLFGRDPDSKGLHKPGELLGVEVGEDLDVEVLIFCKPWRVGWVVLSGWLRLWNGVKRRLCSLGLRVVVEHHAYASVAKLLGLCSLNFGAPSGR